MSKTFNAKSPSEVIKYYYRMFKKDEIGKFSQRDMIEAILDSAGIRTQNQRIEKCDISSERMLGIIYTNNKLSPEDIEDISKAVRFGEQEKQMFREIFKPYITLSKRRNGNDVKRNADMKNISGIINKIFDKGQNQYGGSVLTEDFVTNDRVGEPNDKLVSRAFFSAAKNCRKISREKLEAIYDRMIILSNNGYKLDNEPLKIVAKEFKEEINKIYPADKKVRTTSFVADLEKSAAQNSSGRVNA